MNNRTIHRRDFLKAAGLLAASMTLPGCNTNSTHPTHNPNRQQPNILFIMVDDLGPEWISCYGGQEMKTPHIDRLAEGGMRFTNAYSMPQCTPTRVTLLTGQYPFRHGWVNHWDVPRFGAGCHFDWNRNHSFARILKSAGYATCAVGKWQINDFRVQPHAMKMHGFDECCMWTGYESHNPPSSKRYWDPYIHTNQGSKTYQGKFGTDLFVDYLTDFMKRNKHKPMMLYFPMCLTHGPFTHTPLDPHAKTKIKKHKAMVRYTDHAVGKLVKTLDELNIRKNTIIIFTTDNGTAKSVSARMNGRLVKGGKASLGESGTGQPFIVNCPGLVPNGIVTDALTDFTDMLPTFAELANAKLDKKIVLDGTSIAPLILGKTTDSTRQWIMAMGFGLAKLTQDGVVGKVKFADRVIRDKRYKLWVLDAKPAKLFDLLKDPAETHNLIHSSNPQITAAREKLNKVLQSFPKTDAHPRYDPLPPQPWDKKPSRTKS